MPHADHNKGLDEFDRNVGLNLPSLCVPGPQAPGFREEAYRQALLLRGAAEETEALAFIETAADWDEGVA